MCSGWTEIRNKEGIRVCTKAVDDNPIKNGRASGIVQASPDEIVGMLRSVEYYHLIDPLYKVRRFCSLQRDGCVFWFLRLIVC